MTYGGTYNAWRYSPLDPINRENVDDLMAAWVFQTGQVDGGLSTTPLIVDGVLDLPAPRNRSCRPDGVTGQATWHHHHHTKDPRRNHLIPLIPTYLTYIGLTTPH